MHTSAKRKYDAYASALGARSSQANFFLMAKQQIHFGDLRLFEIVDQLFDKLFFDIYIKAQITDKCKELEIFPIFIR